MADIDLNEALTVNQLFVNQSINYLFVFRYRAPECLLTDGYYTHKMDMWSVGCVFFEVLR